MVIAAVSSPGSLPRFGRLVDSRDPRAGPDTATEFHDAHVEISPQAERLRVQNRLLRSTLGEVEGEVFPAGSRALEEAGYAQYLASLRDESEGSAEATAERILRGIQGYIYRAFMVQHPGATPEDFERFKAAVIRGYERGLFDARSALAGLGGLEPELSEEIDHTKALVREGLREFFAGESERVRLRSGFANE